MLNMSDQFYDYLSEKLLEYFYKNNPIKGDRFYINFDEEDQVQLFYDSLEKIAINKVLDFTYTHEISKKVFNTYYIDINGVKLVVANSLSVNVDYLVTLRNQVTSQKGDWVDTAILVICHEAIDSIYNGMRDLQKEGMPFNVKYISENLDEEIDNSELKTSDKCITKFALKNQEDEMFQITLWDYRTILSILKKGHIDEKDLKELNLFKDTQLENFFSINDSINQACRKINSRLKENFETFVKVKSYSQYDNKKDKLEKMFTSSVVSKLMKDNWYEVEWKIIKKSMEELKDILKNPLIYFENEEKFTEKKLVYWERPSSSSKSGLRKRNIIVFNDQGFNNISLTFNFDKKIYTRFLDPKNSKIAETSGKSLKVTFDVENDKPTFKSIRYKHNFNYEKKEDNEEGPVTDFTFNILVLNSSQDIFRSIKSRYSLDKKTIIVINDEDSDEIVLGNGSEELTMDVENNGDTVDLYDENKITISEQSPAWDNGELNFNLHYNNNLIPFLIKEKKEKTIPRTSSYIWNLKRKSMENIVFNGVKAIQGTNSFYLEEKFKEFLDLEKKIIDNNIFYAKEIDHSIKKMDVSFNEDLERAYIEILDYFRDYDDSPEDNLPSLFYLDDKLKDLYENFISLFNKEISEIEEGVYLSTLELKKDLLKIGRIDTENKIMFSPLSPINIAYQLELSKQCGNEDLPTNIVERLVPNNLIPYLYNEDDELFKPIFQNFAHEWMIYEKERKVSIGTTNVFISNLVSEKLIQFVKHFSYLFDINTSSPIKINLININDDKEVVKGIFDFVRSRLPDKLKSKKVIPVEINIYSNSDRSFFDKFFECNSEDQFIREFGLKSLDSDLYDPIDIIHLVQNNITYFKHPYDGKNYEYAHISFYKIKSYNTIADANMDTIETGLSLNGILSSLNSTTKLSEYRTGFGTRNILDFENTIVKTAININELVLNSKNHGKHTYHKNLSIVTTVELDEENIQELYEKSHWITFIEPTFGIEYFDSFNENLLIIHYSDQYTSSSKYDTITVTSRYPQYEDTIRGFLESKKIDVEEDELWDVIRIFNSINGEWLLRLISNSSKAESSNNNQYSREKLSIITAIKYCLSILDHKDIFWIPASMEEVLRIAGNIKLDKKGGIFDSSLKGSYSDDILFIGLKCNNDDIDVIFYPIEVKIGQNNQSVINKGLKQVDNTYKLLKDKLSKFDEDNEFRNKFFRNFFIQIFLSNEKKLVSNHVWDEKKLETIEKFTSKLLNDEFNVSRILEGVIGKGSLVSFKTDANHFLISMDSNKQIIEIPEYFAYSRLVKPVDFVHNEVQNYGTDIDPEDLLSAVDLNSLEEPEVDEEEDIEEFDDEFDDFNDESEEDIEEFNDFSDESENEKEFNGATDDLEEDSVDEGSEDYDNNNFNVSKIRALIGTQKNHTHKIHWEFGHPSLSNRHMLIQGKSGEGKTYFIQRMLKEVSTQGVPSIIIDYTDGFTDDKLEEAFKESLGSKIVQHVVYYDDFPLNPFKRNNIMINGKLRPEKDMSIASRFKSILGSVYNFGDQQLMTIYNAVLRGLKADGDNMDLNTFRTELTNDSNATTVLSKLTELLDFNPFVSNEFNWGTFLDNSDGKVLIIQLTGFSRDTQRTISELILWDLWYYKLSNGGEDKPFVVVLDESQNLDFGNDSPCGKILTEGRKHGWSGWFATQSVKGNMSTEEISKLANANEKIYFHPTDVNDIAKNLSQQFGDREHWERELSSLTKGYCIVQGSSLDNKGDIINSRPVTVKIDEIVSEKTNEPDLEED